MKWEILVSIVSRKIGNIIIYDANFRKSPTHYLALNGDLIIFFLSKYRIPLAAKILFLKIVYILLSHIVEKFYKRYWSRYYGILLNNSFCSTILFLRKNLISLSIFSILSVSIIS